MSCANSNLKASKKILKRKKPKLQQTRDLLLLRLVSGEVRVKIGDIWYGIRIKISMQKLGNLLYYFY